MHVRNKVRSVDCRDDQRQGLHEFLGMIQAQRSVLLIEELMNCGDYLICKLALAVQTELEEGLYSQSLQLCVGPEDVEQVCNDSSRVLRERNKYFCTLVDEECHAFGHYIALPRCWIVQEVLDQLIKECQSVWILIIIFNSVQERPRPEECNLSFEHISLLFQSVNNHLKDKISTFLAIIFHE